MVVREGRGVVEPTAVEVPFGSCELEHLTEVASARNSHRGYSNSSSAWKRGSASNPVLIGLAGEWAFQRFLSARRIKAPVVDDSLHNGDGGIDASVAGRTYQVKTSQKCFPSLLVRRVLKGTLKPLVSDRFVFCQWMEGQEFVRLRGWCAKGVMLTRGKLAKGRRGNGEWFNTELNASELIPMEDLAILIKEELRGW